MILTLVLAFDFHRGEISLLVQKCKKRINQLLKAPSSVGRHNSTRVDEGRKCEFLLPIKMKARTVVGRGEEGRLRCAIPDLNYY